MSDVEVDAEIRRAAREQDRDFADVKHHLKHDGGYEALRASLAQEKALELVLGEAKAASADRCEARSAGRCADAISERSRADPR